VFPSAFSVFSPPLTAWGWGKYKTIAILPTWISLAFLQNYTDIGPAVWETIGYDILTHFDFYLHRKWNFYKVQMK